MKWTCHIELVASRSISARARQDRQAHIQSSRDVRYAIFALHAQGQPDSAGTLDDRLQSARLGIPGKVTPADRMVGLGTPGALSPIMHFIASRKFTTSPDANNSAVSSCAIRRRFV